MELGDGCNLQPLMCKIMGVIELSDYHVCPWYNSKVTIVSFKDGPEMVISLYL
jgi:hypothetical protein